MRIRLRGLAVMGMFLACGGPPPPEEQATFTLTDSGGIAVATSSGPGWTLGESWSVDREPLLRVGSQDTDSTNMLFNVVDAAFLSNGGVAIANRGTSQILIFDSTGRRIGVRGRDGDGPGEFRSLHAVFAGPGDTLIGVNWQGVSRVVVFSPEGHLLDTYELQAPFLFNPGVYRPPRFLGSVTRGRNPVMDPAEGVMRPGQSTVLAVAPGGDVDTLLRDVSGPEWMAVRASGTETGWSRTYRAFGLEGMYAFGPSEVYYSDNGTWEISAYDSTGRLRRVMRRAHPRRLVTQALRDAWYRHEYEDRLRGGTNAQRNSFRRNRAVYQEMNYPDSLPAHGRMIADDLGYLWVEEYRPLWETVASEWSVFTPEGAWLGTVVMASRFELYEITEDALLGRRREEFDVEVVAIYRLHRGRWKLPA